MKRNIEIDVDKLKERGGILTNTLIMLFLPIAYFAESQGWLLIRNILGGCILISIFCVYMVYVLFDDE